MTKPSLSSSASVSTSLSSTSASLSSSASVSSSPSSAVSSATPRRSARKTVIGTIFRFFFPCIHQTSTAPTPAPSAANTTTAAPPRSTRRIVIGTIFGHRDGRQVWFSVQNERLSTEPALLLKLSIPMSTLVREMQTGVVRVGLDFNADAAAEPEASHCHLHSVPLWTLFCNGRKLGFAVRQTATRQNRDMLKTIQNVTTGAGVFPCGFGPEEVIYVRANFECVVGNADSESFYLVGPDQVLGEGLNVFLKRTR